MIILASVVFWFLVVHTPNPSYVKDVPGPHQYTADIQQAKKFVTRKAAEDERQGEEGVGALVQNH